MIFYNPIPPRTAPADGAFGLFRYRPGLDAKINRHDRLDDQDLGSYSKDMPSKTNHPNPAQVAALRNEAAAAGDHLTVHACDLVLGAEWDITRSAAWRLVDGALADAAARHTLSAQVTAQVSVIRAKAARDGDLATVRACDIVLDASNAMAYRAARKLVDDAVASGVGQRDDGQD